MKTLKILLAASVLAGITVLANAQRVAKPEKPEIKINKEIFGSWLDDDGFIIPGPKIRNFIDQDRDRIDDRLQATPGARPGKPRPQPEKPVKPEPGEGGVKPILPKPKPGEGGEKPGEGGEKPVRPKPGEGGEKPGEGGEKPVRPKPGEGGEKPGKPGKPKPPKPGEGGEKPGKPGKPERPERPARPELSDDLKDQLDAYKEEHDALRKALGDKIRSLKHPTRAEVKKITKDFQEAQKARLEAQKELSSQIKEGLKAARPERPAKPVVPEVVEDLRKEHDKALKKISKSKKELMEKLSRIKLTPEGHKALLDSFREDQKKLQEEMKNIHRQIREAMEEAKGDAADADVRGGDRPPRRPPPRPDSKTDDRRPSDR